MLAMSSLDIKQFLPEDEYMQLLEKKAKILDINTKLINEVKKINDVFKMKHIDYVILKGVALVLNTYQKMYQRYFDDIDFLVDYDNLDKVTKILHDFGYIQGEIEDGKIVSASRKDILLSLIHI